MTAVRAARSLRRVGALVYAEGHHVLALDPSSLPTDAEELARLILEAYNAGYTDG